MPTIYDNIEKRFADGVLTHGLYSIKGRTKFIA